MPTTKNKFAVDADRSAEANAERRIREGLTTPSGDWSGPSAEAENAFIEANGWEAFGEFYLGRREGADPETKNFYAYPFSEDFERVSLPGLRAIRSYSARNNENGVFEAAGRLMDLYKEQVGETAASKFSVCFKRKRAKFQQVDVDAGTIENVSLIQVGVAAGHPMRIDQRSLETAIEAIGENLPAFITHNGALESDRILEQVGAFTDFRVDAGKLKADFRAFDSFRRDESNRYNRLFDIAGEMPDAFGVSLVFEADLVWVDADAREWAFDDKPPGILSEFPSVRFLNVSSADFVETPAANDGLFSQTTKPTQIMDEENNREKVDAKVEATLAEPAAETEQLVFDEPAADEETGEKFEAQVKELSDQVAELLGRVETLQGKLSESEAARDTLAKALDGADALEEPAVEETKPAGDVVETFTTADPREQRRLWKEEKATLFSAAF